MITNQDLEKLVETSDQWIMERTGIKTRHKLAAGLGVSDICAEAAKKCLAARGIGPDELNIADLVKRVAAGGVREVIMATNATVDGQTTAHYLAERLSELGVPLTRLAHGVPVGGELDWLDDGTLATALKARRAF